MLDQVAAAFDRQDYSTAARLLKELMQQSPENPWVQFYRARLQEVSGQVERAEQIYRQLLREVNNPKLVLQVRQGTATAGNPSENPASAGDRCRQ